MLHNVNFRYKFVVSKYLAKFYIVSEVLHDKRITVSVTNLREFFVKYYNGDYSIQHVRRKYVKKSQK